MEKTDFEQWSRHEIFNFFSGISNPFYMVSFRQDVTNVYSYSKANGTSFYYAMCYLVTKAINSIDAFRYVIRGSDVYKIDGRIPSFTDLKKGSESFHIVTLPAIGSIDEFCTSAKVKSSSQNIFIDDSSESDDLLYLSCLPWIDITGITNERDLASPEAKNDSIPRIAWGKYSVRNGRYELGISIEVNHRLIDGIHIGMFAQKLSEEISELY